MKRLLFILIAISITSCSLTKRVHYGGYHVEWKHFNKSPEKFDACDNEAISTAKPSDEASEQMAEILVEEPHELIQPIEKKPVTEQPSTTIESSTKPETAAPKRGPTLSRIWADFSPFPRPTLDRSGKPKKDITADEAVKNTGWIIFAIGAFLLLSVIIAILAQEGNGNGSGLDGMENIWSFILYILFLLLGWLLIRALGNWGAVGVCAGIMVIGLLFVLAGSIG